MGCCFGQVRDFERKPGFEAGADQPDRPPSGRRTGLNPGASGGDAGAETQLIDVNTANHLEFQTLVGVGKVTAAQLVAGQPYRSIDDACAVSGRLKRHRARLRCGPGAPPVCPAGGGNAVADGGERNALLVVASWNIRHLSSSRDDGALRRIASVMARFHLIAVQEVCCFECGPHPASPVRGMRSFPTLRAGGVLWSVLCEEEYRFTPAP